MDEAPRRKRHEEFAETLQLYTLAVEAAERKRATTEQFWPGRGHDAAIDDRRLVAYYAGYLAEMFKSALDGADSPPVQLAA